MNWIQTFFAAILVLAMIVCFPLGLIWSLNQLFKTGIEITLINWLAVVAFMAFMRIIFTVSVKNITQPNFKA